MTTEHLLTFMNICTSQLTNEHSKEQSYAIRIGYRFFTSNRGGSLAGYQWLGRGDKNAADDAAVKAMRAQLNRTPIAGKIVIGEGEIDDALCCI